MSDHFRDDRVLLAALRTGDEGAFRWLVERHHRALVHVARSYVSSVAVAEEVAQETWLGVVTGLDRFEGRSSLKTWIFRILMNRARTRGEREARTVPLSSLVADDPDGPAVSTDRFLESGRWAGHWATPPTRWSDLPEDRLLADETDGVVSMTISGLPGQQAQVITLRDREGWSSEEVCALLGISEVNQRVLLHRARTKVRAALEQHFASAVQA